MAVAAQLKTPDFVPKLWWTPKKFQNFEKMIPKNYSKKVEKNFELAWVGLSIDNRLSKLTTTQPMGTVSFKRVKIL